ncbi:MAG: AEC family transporter [Bacteroidales bacterium]
MGTEIILGQLLIFGILMLVGAVASWFKLINDDGKDILSRIIIDITLPFLILGTFIRLDSNSAMLMNGLMVFGFTFFNLGLLYLLGTASSSLQKLSPADSTIHTLHTMFGNIVFLGFPLFDALFPGGVGVFYAASYQLASNAITFTYGVYRLSAGNNKSGLKSLINVNTGALVLGFTTMIFGIKVPRLVIDSFSSLGKCTSPLSMVYIGALLAGLNIKSIIKTWSIYILSINKLILAPLLLGLTYLGINRFFNLGLSIEAFVVLVMQASMPCQTIVVVMSRRYGGNHQLATGNLFITTLLSIFTLPLIYLFLTTIFAW